VGFLRWHVDPLRLRSRGVLPSSELVRWSSKSRVRRLPAIARSSVLPIGSCSVPATATDRGDAIAQPGAEAPVGCTNTSNGVSLPSPSMGVGGDRGGSGCSLGNGRQSADTAGDRRKSDFADGSGGDVERR
jgi:hypothetical protein